MPGQLSGQALWHRAQGSVMTSAGGGGGGRGADEGGGMCIQMADSLHRTAEISTTLESSYTPKERLARPVPRIKLAYCCLLERATRCMTERAVGNP